MHRTRTLLPPRSGSVARLLLLTCLAGWFPGVSAQQPAPSTPRQTAFDDNNYRPGEIVNRLPPPPPTARVRRSPPPATTTRSAKWSWKTRQSVAHGTFQWHEQNGRIDYASVCMNEQPGSLRYRDCRKGAKVAFARLCKARRDPAACHAQNNYSALR